MDNHYAAVKLEVLAARPRITGMRVGTVIDIGRAGPVVDFPGNPLGPRVARRTASVSDSALQRAWAQGLSVLITFEDNDAARPIVVDIIVDEEASAIATGPATQARAAASASSAMLAPGSLHIAQVNGIEDGKILLELASRPGEVLRADSVVALRNLQDPVLLLQADDRTVVVGQLMEAALLQGEGDESAELVIRGDKVRIEAGSLLSLTAGTCTFELDARGRAVMLGDQIVSRARVSNKIQGGNVQIN